MRLCYAGEVLRINGSQLRPGRQFTQAGAELIGTASPEADAEMVLTAAETLSGLGIQDIKVDLCQPTLIPYVMDALGIQGDDAVQFRAAFDSKDAAEVKTLSKDLGSDARTLLSELLAASGPVEIVAPKIKALPLSGDAAAARDALLETIALIEAGDPALDLTLDVVEYRGFEYHSGVTFTLFAPGVRGELGSGGRYQAGLNDSENSGEAATGFTLFLDSILRALEPRETMPKVYLPAKTSRADGQGVRDQGYRTLQGHTDYGDINVAATRLGCSHIWLGGDIKPLGTV